jgi:hypothetical protein
MVPNVALIARKATVRISPRVFAGSATIEILVEHAPQRVRVAQHRERVLITETLGPLSATIEILVEHAPQRVRVAQHRERVLITETLGPLSATIEILVEHHVLVTPRTDEMTKRAMREVGRLDVIRLRAHELRANVPTHESLAG